MSAFIHKSLKIRCRIYTMSTVKTSAVLGTRQILFFSLGNRLFFFLIPVQTVKSLVAS